MDIYTYLKPLIKWWRLLVVATLIAAVSSAISVFSQPDLYVSRTTLMIGRTILDPNPDSGQIYIASQLVNIYADMAKREPIRIETMNALGTTWLPGYQARAIPNTQLLEIVVTDTNPQRAQIVANELANQLINQSPAISSTETAQRQEFIKQQLSGLQVQIQETEGKIEELQKSLISMNSASQVANTEREISDLNLRLTTLRRSYADFLANSQEGALNILSVVEPASLPTRAVGTNKYLIIFLAATVGFSLASGGAYFIEYIDRTIKTTSDVERVLNFPVIGYLSDISQNENTPKYVTDDPESVVAESFRLLRSNLDFFKIDSPTKTILITSPNQGNGKTTVATNLALLMAQGDQKVLLVDADMRRPAVHAYLNIEKEPGLVDAIRGQKTVVEVARVMKDSGLSVLTVGTRPPNVTEIVGSKRISSIFEDLKKAYEVIIVDAPPLVISDAYNLAAKADGVILIMEPGQTREEQARVIKEQLERAGATVIGVVFNKVSPVTASSYGDYQYLSLYSPNYYSDYVSDAPKVDSAKTLRSKKFLAFFERGEVPDGVSSSIEKAITAIKTQPRELIDRMRKSKKNSKSDH
jgi:capsular exopolysaccharide synthesis family protein